MPKTHKSQNHITFSYKKATLRTFLKLNRETAASEITHAEQRSLTRDHCDAITLPANAQYTHLLVAAFANGNLARLSFLAPQQYPPEPKFSRALAPNQMRA